MTIVNMGEVCRMEKSFLASGEIAESFIETGYKKTHISVKNQFILAILAGAFIAFAAQGSNVAIHTITSTSVSKLLSGAIFSTGLMMVVIAGAELFTGNNLIVISYLERRISFIDVLKNWFFVYLGNFVGSVIIAFFVNKSGQLGVSAGLLGGFTIKTAVYKTGLTFGGAFFLGILCNWLVCIAVWMAAGAKDIVGKVFAIFFPIWLFVTSGFEHSIANMYYVPAGIFAKGNQAWVDAALTLGVKAEQIDALTWESFFTKNLLPVTLGNLVGGVVFVASAYWLVHLRKDQKKVAERAAKAS